MPKKREHITEAEEIGYDSWCLNAYMDLPANASKERQVAALKRDREWQEDHMQEIDGRIEQLIQRIESE